MAEREMLPEHRYDNIETYRYRVANSLGVTCDSIVRYRNRMRPLEEVIISEPDLALTELISRLEKNGTSVNRDSLILALFRTKQEQPTEEELQKFLSQLQKFDDYRDVTSTSELRYRHNQAMGRERDRIRTDASIAAEIELILASMDRSWNYEGHFIRTTFTIEQSSRMYRPTYRDGTVPTIRNGQQIFDTIVSSYRLPFIQYNDANSNANFKIFKGLDHGFEPNYRYTTRSRIKRPKSHTFQMTLWMGDPQANNPSAFYDDISEAFLQVNYDLESGELIVKIPDKSSWYEGDISQGVSQKLNENLPFLTLGESIIVSIQGNFELVPIYKPQTIQLADIHSQPERDNFVMIPSILSHLMLNEPVFTRQIYLDERTNASAVKKKFQLRYRPMYSRLKNRSRIPGSHYTTVRFSPRMIYNSNLAYLDVVHRTSNKRIAIHPGYGRLLVQVTDAISLEEIDRFANNLIALFNLYQWGKCPNVERQLQSVMPEFRANISTTANLRMFYQRVTPESVGYFRSHESIAIQDVMDESRRAKKEQNRGLQLMKQYGEVFVKGYATSCGGDRQPIAITSSQLGQHQDMTYTRKGQTYKRQLVPYPPPPAGTLFWYYCPSNTYPVPNLVRIGVPNAKFQYVPCCTMTRSEVDNYSKLYEGVSPGVQKFRTRLETGQLLSPGRHGKLPLALEGLLEPLIPQGWQLNHYGVDRSINSLLHSILLAVGDTEYIRLLPTTGSEREQYVRAMRTKLFQYVYPSVLKQELFDVEDSKIVEEVWNSNSVLDTLIHYRILEEYFNLNIFTFIPKGSQLTGIELEVPRHRHYHARPLRLHLPTALIYKYQGTQNNSFPYPQFDLIILRNEDSKQDRRLFESQMTLFCHNLLLQLHQTITWDGQECPAPIDPELAHKLEMMSLQPTATEVSEPFSIGASAAAFPQTSDRLCSYQPSQEDDYNSECQLSRPIPYLNFHCLYDIGYTLGQYCISQYIDSNGKAQAFTFQYKREYLTILVPPTQPANLPHSDTIFSGFIGNLIELFGMPSSHYRDYRTGNNGLWFPLHGMSQGFFGYYQRRRKDGWQEVINSLKNGPRPLLALTRSTSQLVTGTGSGTSPSADNESISEISRLTKLRKTISVIRQLLQWIFNIWRISGGSRGYRSDTIQDYSNFSQQYITVDNEGHQLQDSSSYYNIHKIANSLPTFGELSSRSRAEGVDIVELAISHIPQESGLIYQGKFIMYNRKFAFDMIDDLKRYQNATFNLPLQLMEYLEDHYVTETDYKQTPGVLILLGDRDLDSWLESRTEFTASNLIKRQLQLSDSRRLKPFLYQAPNKKVYLIQNSIDGRIEAAAAICHKWSTKHYNPGPIVRGLEVVNNYLLYGINTEGQLYIRENRTTNSQYYRILIFKGSDDGKLDSYYRHAALLEML